MSTNGQPPPPPPPPSAPAAQIIQARATGVGPRPAAPTTGSAPRPMTTGPQQPRPRMIAVPRGMARGVPAAASAPPPAGSSTGPRPRPQMVQIVRQKVPRTQLLTTAAGQQQSTTITNPRGPPPPPPPSSMRENSGQIGGNGKMVPPPPPPPGVRPPPPPPMMMRSSPSPSVPSSSTTTTTSTIVPPSKSRTSVLIAPQPQSHDSSDGQLNSIPRISELASHQRQSDETSSISAISTDPSYEPSSPSKAIGSWSTLASALSDIALSNKLREHLTDLKDQVVQQAHEVAMSIHAVHEEETQRIIRQCLDEVGPLKKSSTVSSSSSSSSSAAGTSSSSLSSSMFENDPFMKDLSLQTEGKLTWDDVRQILSLRTMTFQQKKLMDIANKTERDFLLEKIEQVLSAPTKLSFARSLESANQCLEQFYQGKEQLLLHQIAFYDEKINEFIYNTKRQLTDVQSEISIHYQGYEKSKTAMLLTYEQMKQKYQEALMTIHVDNDEHSKLISHLLDSNLSWGSERMKEIATSYHNNDELVYKRDALFANIDSLLLQCYEKVYERISQEDGNLHCLQSEQFIDKLNQYKRCIFAWKQQHSQSMEDRLSYIQSVMDGYYMSIVEDLIEEKSELLRLQFINDQYDMNLTHYLNEFFMRENNTKLKLKQGNNKNAGISSGSSAGSGSNKEGNNGNNITIGQGLEEIDLEALLRFQTFGPPQQRQNVLRIGSSLRVSANLAGLSKVETVHLMQQLLMAGRRKAMY